jgi:phospholipid-binding lipoprotein MlaA
MVFPRLRAALVMVTLGAALAGGCTSRLANPDDPLQDYNRAMFNFNESVDKAVIRPVAEAYDRATPLPVRTGIGNFFGNLGDIWIGLNNLLQGKFVAGLSDGARFGLNATFGILGLFDVASEVGLAKNDEDFGQTLGRWGVGEGAYFVVPFFGPRTLRDAAVLPVDLYGDNVWGIGDIRTRNSLTALRLVNARANLLGIDKTLEEGTLDKYSYARDFYLQQRRYRVFDGSPPAEYEDFNGGDAALPPGFATDVAARAALAEIQLVRADSPAD